MLGLDNLLWEASQMCICASARQLVSLCRALQDAVSAALGQALCAAEAAGVQGMASFILAVSDHAG